MVESVAACVYREPGGSKQAGGRRHKYAFLRKALIWSCAPFLVDALARIGENEKGLCERRGSVFRGKAFRAVD